MERNHMHWMIWLILAAAVSIKAFFFGAPNWAIWSLCGFTIAGMGSTKLDWMTAELVFMSLILLLFIWT
jgi:hypothetical protein